MSDNEKQNEGNAGAGENTGGGWVNAPGNVTASGDLQDWRDARIAELEQENRELLEAATAPADAAEPWTYRHGFDVDARRKELLLQGLSEEDAAETAGYEERTYNDKQNRQQ